MISWWLVYTKNLLLYKSIALQNQTNKQKSDITNTQLETVHTMPNISGAILMSG